MRIEAIKAEYEKIHKDAINKYAQMFRERIEEVLKELGMFEVDVEDKRGRIGRLEVGGREFNEIGYDIYFYPYKKDGTLSKKYELAIYYFNSDEDLKRTLTESYKVVG